MKKPAGIRNNSYFKVPQRLNAGDLETKKIIIFKSLINKPLSSKSISLNVQKFQYSHLAGSAAASQPASSHRYAKK